MSAQPPQWVASSKTRVTQKIWLILTILMLVVAGRTALASETRQVVGTTPAAQGIVKADNTSLRTGPGTAYDPIEQLPKDEIVQLQLRYQDWLKVTTATGVRGWLSIDALRIADGVGDQLPIAPFIPPSPTPTATVAPTRTAVPTPTAPPTEQPTTTAPETVIPAAPETTTSTPDDSVPATGTATPPAPEPSPSPARRRRRPTPTPTATPSPAPESVARWVWPTQGEITSGFGYRALLNGRFHNGIDIANVKWTPIMAARTGTVIEAHWCSGYGYCVKMKHGAGFITEYGHMAAMPPVHVGQYVEAGAVIGYMGSTYDREGGGYATGVHLHFTIKLDGSAVNPLNYLPSP